MDLSQSIEARSDQINADDLVSGPATYTIREVVQGKAEAPFDFLLVETDRAYRPSKTMRRVIVNAWGPEASQYAGRRLTVYREPSIMFGGQRVGGIRVSHMSHIDKPTEVMVQTTRGKRETFKVLPLPDAPTQQPSPLNALLAEIKQAADAKGIDLATVAQEWKDSHDGQDIRQATDVGGLELLRDDLRSRAAINGADA